MKAKTPAVAKLKMMKASIRCLTLGLLSLLPVIGAGFTVFALWYSFVARRQEKLFWNPAKPHRMLGVTSAALGGLIWGGVDTVCIYHALNPY